ncbi:unnamed protein product [Ascophyllum nodosum]
MAEVINMKCVAESRGKRPSFGVAGTKTAEDCTQLAPDNMTVVISRKQCRTECCSKHPSFGGAGTKSAEYYPQRSLFDVDGTSKAEYCEQHTRMERGVEGYKGREIGNASPRGAKQNNARPFPAQASPPSGDRRASRKRE